MNDNFFADYKKFIVSPDDEKKIGREIFDPKNFPSHFILTLSIFNSRLSTWEDASKYDINVRESIETVLDEFNQKQYERYHLQLLELDKTKDYFVLALSSKIKFDLNEENDQISFIVNKMLTNPFYVGQKWFNLIGEKGRVNRKLFCCSFMKYAVENQDQSTIEKKYLNISEFVPKNGEIKLVKNI
jgi:hypothetical protein